MHYIRIVPNPLTSRSAVRTWVVALSATSPVSACRSLLAMRDEPEVRSDDEEDEAEPFTLDEYEHSLVMALEGVRPAFERPKFGRTATDSVVPCNGALERHGRRSRLSASRRARRTSCRQVLRPRGVGRPCLRFSDESERGARTETISTCCVLETGPDQRVQVPPG